MASDTDRKLLMTSYPAWMEKTYSSSNPVSLVTLAQTVFEIFEIACTEKWVLSSQSVSLAQQTGGIEPGEYHSINNHAEYCDNSSSRLEEIRSACICILQSGVWCRPEIANDVISSVNGEDLQFKQPCKFGDSSSNRLRDIQDSVHRQVGTTQSVSFARTTKWRQQS